MMKITETGWAMMKTVMITIEGVWCGNKRTYHELYDCRTVYLAAKILFFKYFAPLSIKNYLQVNTLLLQSEIEYVILHIRYFTKLVLRTS